MEQRDNAGQSDHSDYGIACALAYELFFPLTMEHAAMALRKLKEHLAPLERDIEQWEAEHQDSARS